jgi:hypothetical protein
MTDPNESLPELPDALVEGLRRGEPATLLVPRAIDEMILRRARMQFATREAAYLPPIRNYWLSAAAAATVAIVVFATMTLRHEAAPPAARLADDVDGSGQVDVLDAFALARRNAPHPDPAAQTRIEALLARIVSLSPAKASQS